MHDLLQKAVESFLKEQPSLFEYDAYEPAMSHRIAFHLEQSLMKTEWEGLNVDCEYNRHLDKIKKTIRLENIGQDELKACGCWNCKRILENGMPADKEFRPDIIIHWRGVDDFNTLVVEAKKTKKCPFDLEKLKALTSDSGEYRYKLGAFIYFPENSPKYYWFRNGSIV